MIPATIPRNGLVTAVTTRVDPPTAALVARAAGASKATVLKIPSTNKNPAIEEAGTYLLIFGRIPRIKITPITTIIATPAHTGCGALAVAEIIDSTGAPPKKEDPISAREEITVRWSTL